MRSRHFKRQPEETTGKFTPAKSSVIRHRI